MRVTYLTPSEAARLLGLSRSGVVWLIDTRRLRATKTPTGRRLVSIRDLERLQRDRQAAREGGR